MTIYLILALLTLVSLFVTYIFFGKNKSLKKDLASTHQFLLDEIDLRKRLEEANKAYVQKLATLSKGTDADRFNAAVSIMSDGKASPPKPDTKS